MTNTAATIFASSPNAYLMTPLSLCFWYCICLHKIVFQFGFDQHCRHSAEIWRSSLSENLLNKIIYVKCNYTPEQFMIACWAYILRLLSDNLFSPCSSDNVNDAAIWLAPTRLEKQFPLKVSFFASLYAVTLRPSTMLARDSWLLRIVVPTYCQAE